MNSTQSRDLHSHLFGDEIVISGISGRFPLANNVQELAENLYNHKEIATDISVRFLRNFRKQLPERIGMILEWEQFDAGFFGVPQKQAEFMEPMCRVLLESTYEAILDAGMNPSDFEGTRTAVLVGNSTCESEITFYRDGFDKPKTFCVVESVKSALVNRISYWLKIDGASHVLDSACSSSLYALEEAYTAFKENRCDYVILGGCSACMNPFVTLQFKRLGILSQDCACKSFDEAANGYLRSETIVTMVLQRASTAKRVYAQIVHAGTNCDGYKEEGITFPSGDAQKILLQDFYQACEIDPTTLTYLEAHGTGTQAGDPQELNAIDKVFCTGRNRPLHIGSVKSNIGHNEPASGLSAVAKVLIGFETGLIPPNNNFQTPRKCIEGLQKGRMLVVTEEMPWPDNNGLVGLCVDFFVD